MSWAQQIYHNTQQNLKRKEKKTCLFPSMIRSETSALELGGPWNKNKKLY